MNDIFEAVDNNWSVIYYNIAAPSHDRTIKYISLWLLLV